MFWEKEKCEERGCVSYECNGGYTVAEPVMKIVGLPDKGSTEIGKFITERKRSDGKRYCDCGQCHTIQKLEFYSDQHGQGSCTKDTHICETASIGLL